jgi:hypothetical protein
VNSKLLCRLIIALSGVAAMVAGCKDVEIKPQDPGNYNRALRQRAEIVKKVMAEKGMKMIEASKYVKEHGLY